ncbi:hypothetical protein UPYG_G00256150 [Umbra pygmaea]|uniref:Uncharacterized protein n=1 Tax=Umbra pygmaea TaxID=75934 RepID=A0ABD0WDC3_UMBPY
MRRESHCVTVVDHWRACFQLPATFSPYPSVSEPTIHRPPLVCLLLSITQPHSPSLGRHVRPADLCRLTSSQSVTSRHTYSHRVRLRDIHIQTRILGHP